MLDRLADPRPLPLRTKLALVIEVLAVYASVFECSIKEARDQLRSPEGLEAALSRPRSYAYYRQADMALQASVLAHAIAEGQVFVEGNKRTALAAMATLLAIVLAIFPLCHFGAV